VRVWIDIDNAPHVQLFRPIISRLRERGASVEITSRDRTFVPELLRAAGIEHTVIERGQPSAPLDKATALARRAISLARFARGRRFDVAVGHGSRSLPIAAKMARVRNMTMFDYEHVSTWIFRCFCDRILVPRAITGDGAERGAWRAFEGFKEEIYLADFSPDANVRAGLGVREDEVLAVVRPPSRTAHYHDDRSTAILSAVMERIAGANGVRTIWLRRDPGDRPPVLGTGKVIVPESPVDGPSLLAAADLAISGGGTMNREAALLGTPAYTIFTGTQGALDADLIRQGRLFPIRAVNQVDSIPLVKKSANARPQLNSRLRDFVVDQIEELARVG
jgi:uncharacterized protein